MKYGLIAKNTVVYAIANVILRFTTFLLIPIYINNLSQEEYGLLSTMFVTSEFLVIIMTAGMREAQIRFYSEYERTKQLGTLMASSTIVSIVSGVLVSGICIFIFPSFFQKIFHADHVSLYIILACSAGLVQTLYEHLSSFYRSTNESIKFTFTHVASAILLIIINGIIYKYYKYNVMSPLISQVMAYGIVFIIVSINVFNKIGIKFKKETIKKLLTFGIPLIFSSSGQRIFLPTATYMLSFYSGLTSVAIFSLGIKFAGVVYMMLVLPFQMAFQPFLYVRLQLHDIKETISLLLTYFIFLFVLISTIVIIGTKILIPMISPPEYFQAFSVFILSLSATGFSSLIVFGEALINIRLKTRATGVIIALTGLIGVILNYLLIPILDWHGALISLNLSSLATGAIMLWYGNYCYPIRIEWKRILPSLLLFSLIIMLSYIVKYNDALIIIINISTLIILISYYAKYLHIQKQSELSVL